MKLPEERIRIEMSKVMQLILIKIYPLNQMCVVNRKNNSRIFERVGHETRFSTESSHHQTNQNYEQPPQNISQKILKWLYNTGRSILPPHFF